VSVQADYETERGKPLPSEIHSMIQSRLIFELMLNYRKNFDFLSELSLELDFWKSVPDISICSKTSFNHKNDEIKVEKAPLGVIEILSLTQNFQELIEKAQEYFEHGVKSCWLVMPSVRNI
jgi:Uma2 family endonuclease